jgi:hypothetical protein
VDTNPFDQFDATPQQPQVMTVGTPRPPKPEGPPSGYRYANGGQSLEAIPGGPADPNKDAGNVGASNLTGGDYLKSLDAPTANMVKALAEGRKSFPSGSALRAPYWQNMLAHVSNYDPGFDEVNYTGRSATRRDFTSGKAANNIRALNTAIGHLGHLEEQIGGTASHSFTPLNAIENTALRVTGDPGPTNFDTTVSALAGELTAVYRGAGGAEADIQRYIQQLNPNASKAQKDGAIRNIVGLLKSRLDALNDQYRQGMGTTAQQLQLLDPQAQLIVQHLGGFDAAGAPHGPGDNSQGGPAYAPPPTGPNDGGMGPSANGVNEQPDPQSSGFWEAAAKQGLPYGRALKMWAQDVKARGLTAVTPPKPDEYKAVVGYIQANPNIEYHPFESITRQPVAPGQQEMTDAAFSAPGAFAINAGNALAAGIPLAAAGDQGQFYRDVSQAQQPTASTLGDLTGATAAMLGGEAALAKGLGPGLGRELVANSAYGGIRGGAENPQNPALGAIEGAGAGAAGTVAGRAATNGIAALVSPSGGRLSQLYAEGVRPTPGQRAVAAGGGQGLAGLAGRIAGTTEEAIGSIPIVGAGIRGARQEARDQFQVGAFNQALGDIGQRLPKSMNAGTAAHNFTQQAFNRAYASARSGMQVGADAGLQADMQAVASDVANLGPNSSGRFYTILNNEVLPKVRGGIVQGDDYKLMQSRLGKIIRGIRKSANGDGELADTLESLRGALDSAARRHSSPQAVQALDAADRGYAKFVQIENASARGGVAKDAGTFSPNDFAAAVKGGGSRVRSKAYSQGQGLMQDYAEQGKALSDTLPNSGTADRLMVGGAATSVAGGLQHFEPHTAGVLGLIGLLYAPGIRKGIKAAMAPRGPAAQAIARTIRLGAPTAGTVGAALAQGTSPDQ